MYTDEVQLSIYSTDASIYQINPLAIVIPQKKEDVIRCMEIARKFKTAVLCRGGGTSLAGQTVGKAIVLDFTKYFTRILDYRPHEKSIKVEPGIILDSLNNTIKRISLSGYNFFRSILSSLRLAK